MLVFDVGGALSRDHRREALDRRRGGGGHEAPATSPFQLEARHHKPLSGSACPPRATSRVTSRAAPHRTPLISLIGFTSCIVQSFGSRRSFILSPSGRPNFTARSQKFNKDILSDNALHSPLSTSVQQPLRRHPPILAGRPSSQMNEMQRLANQAAEKELAACSTSQAASSFSLAPRYQDP